MFVVYKKCECVFSVTTVDEYSNSDAVHSAITDSRHQVMLELVKLWCGEKMFLTICM